MSKDRSLNTKVARQKRTARQARYRKNHREKHLAQQRKFNREYNVQLKFAVINVLTNGEGTCRWCGQGDIDVLCLDHIHNDGAEHRKWIKTKHYSTIYKSLVRTDYQFSDRLQVLCANCNLKKEVLRTRNAYKG